MEVLNRINLLTRLKGVNINDALSVLQSFGSARLTASNSIGTCSPFFIYNMEELFEEDDFCCCNQYRIDFPEKQICRVSLYYGNNSEKIVDIDMNWIRI